MNNIIITNSVLFEERIKELKESNERINQIFEKLNKNMEKINGETDIWYGATQEETYKKYKELSNNYPLVEESLAIYIKFLENTINEYKKLENKIDSDIVSNNINLQVNN